MASESTLTPGLKDSGLGPLIHMRALDNHQLPTHPDLSDKRKDETPGIQTFASAALQEGEAFMTKYLPNNFTVKDTGKWSPPAKAPVTLFQHDLAADAIPKPSAIPITVSESPSTEHWFARESLHENKAEEQTASWEEFDHGLRVDHSQHEMDYTPDVLDAHEIMNWDSELSKHDRKAEGGWQDVHASVMEMRHKIPAPLNNRVFPVMVITGKKERSFVDLQIPVATKGLPGAKYHDVPKVTGGMYCSIERCELVEGGEKVKWQMATASDAKGVLPMWAQKMGVPGAVVKDVGLFMSWVAERRNKGKV